MGCSFREYEERFAASTQAEHTQARVGPFVTSRTRSPGTVQDYLRSARPMVMSIVSWMVGTADGFLADAAESQFRGCGQQYRHRIVLADGHASR